MVSVTRPAGPWQNPDKRRGQRSKLVVSFASNLGGLLVPALTLGWC